MKIISLASQKGGCGKSTIVINLAINIALKGKRVILFDTDPQQSCAETLQTRTDKLVTVVSLFSNIHRKIKKYSENYDFAFIDTPPHDDKAMALAVICSDLVIIPVQDSPLDVRSSKATVDLVLEAQELHQDLKLYFLLSRIQPNTILAQELRELLARTYDLPILTSVTANRVMYKYAMIYGQAATEMGRDKSATEEIETLTNEIMNILEPR